MSEAANRYGADAAELERLLSSDASRVHLTDFPRPDDRVDDPGLYVWYVDAEGAASLTSGLEVAVAPGLIFGGQAGAGLSSMTLRSRVLTNHMRGNVTASTFRLTLASILAEELGLARDDGHALAGDGEQVLSRWMAAHLRVAVAPVADRARLAILEAVVLADLDPPLNLQGMTPTPVRTAVTRLRRRLTPHAPRSGRQGAHAAPTGVQTVSGNGPDMRAFLTGLVGRTIPTISGRPNRILGITGESVLVGSARSPEGRAVPLASVQDAADRLFAEGELIIDVATVGYRSAFVGAALAALPGARVCADPRRVVLATQEWPPRK